MVANLGAGALAGYALVSRVAVLDAALTAAVGSISLIVVSRAHKARTDRKLLTEIWICAALLGLMTASIGTLAYPVLIDLLANKGPAAEFARSAIFIFISATPLRMILSATSFVFHSLGRGGVVLGLQVCELVVKAALNVPLVWSFGFMGCFIATLLVSILSVFCALAVMRRIVVTEGESPPAGFRASFMRGCMVESTRGLGRKLLSSPRSRFSPSPRPLRRECSAWTPMPPSRASSCWSSRRCWRQLVFRHALCRARPC